jgi:hypothetical protein
LEWVEELEQLIKSMSCRTQSSVTSPNAADCFLSEDIDSICATCYNWGITLVELSQHDLSETFVSKALSLSNFASSDFSRWKETIQVPACFLICASLSMSVNNLN